MNKKVILIVDDEPLNINLVAEILNDLYQIKVATNGIDALKIIDKEKLDLILLDIMMPKMDGYAVALKLTHSKENANIPFIFLTAKNDPQSVAKGFNHGAVDYISKPFAKIELLARVDTHLKINELKKSLVNSVDTLEDKMKELEKSKQAFETIFNKSYNGIALTDLDTNFLMTNDSYSRITGLTREELKHESCYSLGLESEKESSKQIVEDVLVNGYVENKNKLCKIKNKVISVNTSISLMPNKKTLLYNTIDVTDLKKAEAKIAHYMQLMNENIISSSTDLDGVILDASKAFCEISGFSKEEIVAQKHSVLKNDDMPIEFFDELRETITNDETWVGEVKNKKKDGGYYWSNTTIVPDYDDESGKKIGYTAIRHDITDKKLLEELSIRDELTKLYNRRYFNQVLSNELNRASRDKKMLSFMMIDVDHFKLYNDTYGHQEGDVVLSKIGETLNGFTKRADDFAFRIGGEEFGILFSLTNKNDILSFAQDIKKAIKDLKIPHCKNSASSVVTISAELITIQSDKFISQNDVYKKADKLLYNAKENGRNNIKQDYLI